MRTIDSIFDDVRRAFALPEDAKRILQDQDIGDDQPGTVLRDFESLLTFVGDRGLKTTGRYSFLPQGRLDDLNGRMSRPVSHRLKRPQQRSFPHLHGLYLLLRASALGVASGTPPAGRLTIDPEMAGVWSGLNSTERYFTLVESWLVQGRPEILAEPGRPGDGFLDPLFLLWSRLRRPRTIATGDPRGSYGTMDLVTLGLAELFGWLRVDYRAPAPGEGVRPATIERLAFGDAVVAALHAHFYSALFSTLDAEGPPDAGALKPLFEPYFPEWRRIAAPPERSFRDGTFTWRVSLGNAWREIVAPARATLDDLAMEILSAFDFDNDHLYCFYVTDPRGRKLRFSCPYEEDGIASTDDVVLGSLPLREGGVMTFHFDYGDDWLFSVKLLGVAPTLAAGRIRVTARGGRAPAQYRSEDA